MQGYLCDPCGGESLLVSSSFCCLPARLDVPRLVEASRLSHRGPSSLLCVFTPLSSVPICFCVQMSPFYKDSSHAGLGSTLMNSLYLDYLCKDPTPNSGHILKYWEVRLQHISLGNINQSLTYLNCQSSELNSDSRPACHWLPPTPDLSIIISSSPHSAGGRPDLRSRGPIPSSDLHPHPSLISLELPTGFL